MKQLLSDKELDNVSISVTNLVLEHKAVKKEKLEPLLSELNESERELVFSKLKASPLLRFVDGMIVSREERIEDVCPKHRLMSSLMKPEYVNTRRDCIQIGSKFYRGLSCVDFPDVVSNNWLSTLVAEKGDVDFAIFYEPNSPAELLTYLDHELKKVRNDLYMYSSRGESNPVLEQKKQDLEENLKDVSKGLYTLFRMDIHLLCKAQSAELAEELKNKVQSNLKSRGIIAKEAINYQLQCVQSCVPVNANKLGNSSILVPDSAAAAAFPFSTPYEDIDEQGIIVGWNESSLPVARCMWKDRSYSLVFLGPTGSGKSTALKFFLDQEHAIYGTKVLIIDPAASGVRPEYKRLCEKKQGNYISFSVGSNNFPPIIRIYRSPLYSVEENFLNEVHSIVEVLSGMFGGMLGGVTDAQKPWLERAVMMALEMAGIKNDDAKTWEKHAPLEYVYTAFKKLFKETKSENARMSLEALINRCSRFVGSGLYAFINQHNTPLQLNNSFTVFEFRQTPHEIKPTAASIVMNFCKSMTLTNLDRTLIVLEEAHLWLKDPALANFLAEMIVLIRKSNTGLVLVFQDLGQLNNCKQGETLLNNVEHAYIMGCKQSLLKKTAQVFGLNKNEMELLKKSTRGKGILIWGNEHHKVEVKIDPESMQMYTTDPEEIKKIEQVEEHSDDDQLFSLLVKHLGKAHSIAEAAALLLKKPRAVWKSVFGELSPGQADSLRSLIHDAKKRSRLSRKVQFNAEKLVEFWLKSGRKNIMPKDGKLFLSEEVRHLAELRYDIIRNAQQYYRSHAPDTKPMGLSQLEEQLYENVVKQFAVRQKRRESVHTELKNKLWYKKEDLTADQRNWLVAHGYRQSNYDAYDLEGKRIGVVARIDGHESIQHLTYKHLFGQQIPGSVMEYRCPVTHAEFDVMVPLRNTRKLLIEIQTSDQRTASLSEKIRKLDAAADYWIIACKKEDMQRYQQFVSEKGMVLGFREALRKAQDLVKNR